MDAGTRGFPNADLAEPSPLARAASTAAWSKECSTAAISAASLLPPAVSWSDLEPVVLETFCSIIFVSGAPLVVAGAAAGIHVADDIDFQEDPADADIIDQIEEVNRNPRPPGGGGERQGDEAYKGYRDGRLFLCDCTAQCRDVPHRPLRLSKRHIESLIRHYVPEVETVEAV